jgi:hypothetical protein
MRESKRSRILLPLLVALLAGHSLNLTLVKPFVNRYIFVEDSLVFNLRKHFQGIKKEVIFATADPNAQILPGLREGGVSKAIGKSCTKILISRLNEDTFGLCDQGKAIAVSTVSNTSVSLIQLEIGYVGWDIGQDAAGNVLITAFNATSKTFKILKLLAKTNVLDSKPVYQATFSNDEWRNFEIKFEYSTPEPSVIFLFSKTSPGFLLLRLDKDEKGEFKMTEFSTEKLNIPEAYKDIKMLSVSPDENNNLLISYQFEGKVVVAAADFSESKIEVKTPFELRADVDGDFAVKIRYDRGTKLAGVSYVDSSSIRIISFYRPTMQTSSIQVDNYLKIEGSTILDTYYSKDDLIFTGKKDDKTTLYIWRLDESMLEIYNFAEPINALAVGIRRDFSDPDNHILKLVNGNGNTLESFHISQRELVVKGTNTAFQDGKPKDVTFTALENGVTSTYKFQVQVLPSLNGQGKFALGADYDVYAGQTSNILVQDDNFAGNAPTFTVLSGSEDLVADQEYANSAKAKFKLKDKADENLKIKDMEDIGMGVYMALMEQKVIFFLCQNYKGTAQIDCSEAFQFALGDETILSASYDLEGVYVLSKQFSDKIEDRKLILRGYDIGGEELVDPQEYPLDVNEGTGTLKIIENFIVMTAFVNKGGVLEGYFSKSTKNKEFSSELTKISPLGVKACPRSLKWGAMNSAIIYLESKCPGENRLIMELDGDFENLGKFEFREAYPVLATGEAEICMISRTMIMFDLEKSEISAVSLDEGENNRSVFPFKHYGMDKILEVRCSDMNDNIQVLASKKDQNGATKFHLITYRGDAINLPNNRVHSIQELPMADPKTFFMSSKMSSPEVFSVIFGQNLLVNQGTLTRLTVPRFVLNATKLKKEGKYTLTVKMTLPGVEGPESIESVANINLFVQDNSIGFLPREKGQKKVSLAQSVILLDQYFKLTGTNIEQTIEGNDNFELVPKTSKHPVVYPGVINAFYSLVSQDDFTFAYTLDRLFVLRNQVEVAVLTGIYIKSINIIKGKTKDSEGVEREYFYIVGISRAPETLQPDLFVYAQNTDGTFAKYTSPIHEGISHGKVFLLDSKGENFYYVGYNNEENTLYMGSASFTDSEDKSTKTLKTNSNERLFRYDSKMSTFDAFLINKVIKVIFTISTVSKVFVYALDPIGLKVLTDFSFELMLDSSENFSRCPFSCSQTYSDNITYIDPILNTDPKIYCLISSRTLVSYGVVIDLGEQASTAPTYRDKIKIKNFQGFKNIYHRNSQGFLSIGYQKLPEISKDLLKDSELANVAYFFAIYKIGSSEPYQLILPNHFGSDESKTYKGMQIDFEREGKEEWRLVAISNADKKSVKCLRLNKLALKIKDISKVKTADLSKIKMIFRGLTQNIEVPLSLYFDSNPIKEKKNLTHLIYMISGGLGLMLVIATLYCCLNRSSSSADLSEQERIEITDEEGSQSYSKF